MKRLYRSTEEGKIAGVCSGLGEYFDLDPVLFRLFFILLAFFGGTGVLAYLVLWIMVPPKGAARGEAGMLNRLRLSRSDRKIAGVCGGLGEFFDIDPVIFRAMFIVLAFFWGLGILLYIALWLAMPQAAADSAAGPGGSSGGEAPLGG